MRALSQVPLLIATQKEVVLVNAGVLKVAFCWVSGVPPLAAVYHLYCPFVPPLATIEMLVPLQPLLLIALGAAGGVLTIASICVRLLSQLVAMSKTET